MARWLLSQLLYQKAGHYDGIAPQAFLPVLGSLGFALQIRAAVETSEPPLHEALCLNGQVAGPPPSDLTSVGAPR